jgi:large subunit ribosomal protein L27
MAHTKAGGTARNLNDSNPKYLGVKRADGQKVSTGEVIVRQRGTAIMAGHNIGIGKDHTLFARADGIVRFRNARKTNYDGRTIRRRMVEIVSCINSPSPQS